MTTPQNSTDDAAAGLARMVRTDRDQTQQCCRCTSGAARDGWCDACRPEAQP